MSVKMHIFTSLKPFEGFCFLNYTRIKLRVVKVSFVIYFELKRFLISGL